jgi:hypothetical protein
MRSFLSMRFGAFLSFIAFAVACAEPAFADTGGSASTAILSAIGLALLGVVTSPNFWAALVAVVVLLVARKNPARAAAIEKGIVWAFNSVEDMKQMGTLGVGADKIELALRELNTILSTQGITVTDAEKLLAKKVWAAMHGASSTLPVGPSKSANEQSDASAPAGSTRSNSGLGALARAAGAAALFFVVLSQAACFDGWTAAEKAAPACYGLNASSLTTIVTQGKQTVTDASTCVKDDATCVAQAEAALALYLANQQLDDSAVQCVLEAIQLEIKYPHGGEPIYAPPDAGAPLVADAGTASPALRVAARNSAAVIVDHKTAISLTAISHLQIRGIHGSAHG